MTTQGDMKVPGDMTVLCDMTMQGDVMVQGDMPVLCDMTMWVSTEAALKALLHRCQTHTTHLTVSGIEVTKQNKLCKLPNYSYVITVFQVSVAISIADFLLTTNAAMQTEHSHPQP